MSERKREVVEALRVKGIDPVKIEREVLALMRRGASSLEVRSYFKKLLEGEKK